MLSVPILGIECAWTAFHGAIERGLGEELGGGFRSDTRAQDGLCGGTMSDNVLLSDVRL